MGISIDAANVNPHVDTGDCECISRSQCSPQLGFLIHIGLEVHMDTVNQDETSASVYVVEINRVILPPNAV